MFSYRVARMALAFFITVWIARHLGPEDYGTLVFAITIAELVMIFWSQGMKEVIVSRYRESGYDKQSVAMASFLLMSLGNILLYGLLALLLFLWVGQNTVIILSLLCGIGILFRAFEAFELWFHSGLNVKVTVSVQFFSQLLYMAVVALLILTDSEIIWYGAAYALQLIVTGIGFLAVFYLFNKKLLGDEIVPIYRDLLKLSKFMILSKLLVTSSFLIDRLLVEYYLGMDAVGLYSAAMKMVVTWIFISSSISLSFLPVLGTANEIQRKEFVSEMFGWITSFSIALVVPFFFLAGFLVQLVFGDSYVESASIFRILVLSIPFLLLNEGIKTWLVTIQKTNYYIASMAVTTILCIVLNILLIPSLGLEGAAAAFVVSWIVGNFLLFSFFRETRGLAGELILSFYYPFKKLFAFFRGISK